MATADLGEDSRDLRVGYTPLGGRPAAGRRFGIGLDGLEEVMPNHPTLADVDSADALAAYQEKKKAYQQRLKAEGGSFDANDIGKPGRG